MPVYTVELDGKQYDLEGDHPPSEAEARSAIGGTAPKTATPPPASATIGMMQPSTAKGDPEPSTAENLRNTLQWGGKVIAGMMGMNAPGVISPGIDAVENPKTTLATAAVPLAAQKLVQAVPGVVEAGKRLRGVSSARAVTNLQESSAAAKGVPLNDTGVWKEGTRAQELVARGSKPAGAVTKLMNRIGDVNAEPLTFEEARDYYSNISRLSANEFNSLNSTMQRQVGAVKQALHEALTDAAGTVGKGEQYAKGIKEYGDSMAAAAKWEEKTKPMLMKMLKSAAKWGGGGAVFEGGRRAYEAIE